MMLIYFGGQVLSISAPTGFTRNTTTIFSSTLINSLRALSPSDLSLALLTETFRGFSGCRKGQLEAARAFGMNPRVFVRILFHK